MPNGGEHVARSLRLDRGSQGASIARPFRARELPLGLLAVGIGDKELHGRTGRIGGIGGIAGVGAAGIGILKLARKCRMGLVATNYDDRQDCRVLVQVRLLNERTDNLLRVMNLGRILSAFVQDLIVRVDVVA